MGKTKTSESYIDLTYSKRSDSLLNGIRFIGIKSDSLSWELPFGSKMRFTIYMKSTKALNSIGFRIRITSAAETSVSVLLAPNLINCNPNEEIAIPLEADISQLIPEKYNMTIGLYGVNEFGGDGFYDHIVNAITFQITTVNGFNENMNWNPIWWGYVKLPDLIDLR